MQITKFTHNLQNPLWPVYFVGFFVPLMVTVGFVVEIVEGHISYPPNPFTIILGFLAGFLSLCLVALRPKIRLRVVTLVAVAPIVLATSVRLNILSGVIDTIQSSITQGERYQHIVDLERQVGSMLTPPEQRPVIRLRLWLETMFPLAVVLLLALVIVYLATEVPEHVPEPVKAKANADE